MSASLPLLAPRANRKISLTALIDVVFILLMFFMLTSSFIPYGVLNLDTPTASANTRNDKPQMLRLSANSSVSIVGDKPAGEMSLEDAVLQLNLEAPIVLLPHADTDLQTILSVFEALKSHGAQALVLGDAWGNKGV